MATKKSKKAVKPAIKDLKKSKKQVSAEEADAIRGGSLPSLILSAKKPKPTEPTKTIVSTDITHTADDDVDIKTD
jgi:hypothetical protein